MEKQKTKAAGLHTLTASEVPLNPNNTSIANQHAIVLAALEDGPKTTIELRHDFGVMMPAARIRELRLAGHSITTIRVVSYTPDGIKHHSIATYVLRGDSHD
jgi:hypothetical protein